VEVEMGNSDVSARLSPGNGIVEVPSTEGFAVLVDEDQTVNIGARIGGEVVFWSRHEEHVGRHSNSHRVTYPICHVLPCPPPLAAPSLGDEVAEDLPETLRDLPRVVPADAEPWRLIVRRWPMKAEVPGRSLVFIREPGADVEGGL
jgi:hypothetical protein